MLKILFKIDLVIFRRDEAAKSLQFYRGKDYNIDAEFSEILKQNEAKNNQIRANSGSGSPSGCSSAIRRIFSPAFGKPYMVVGILQLLNNWGVYTILMINMIDIFRDSATSIPADQAPIYVGVIQVTFYFFPNLPCCGYQGYHWHTGQY
jgi:hypothetical protein